MEGRDPGSEYPLTHLSKKRNLQSVGDGLTDVRGGVRYCIAGETPVSCQFLYTSDN